jgi:hypothetical protein
MAVTLSGDPAHPDYMKKLSRQHKSEQHGHAGEENTVYTCADYCETKALTKIS